MAPGRYVQADNLRVTLKAGQQLADLEMEMARAAMLVISC
jgi:hypothetical protein